MQIQVTQRRSGLGPQKYTKYKIRKYEIYKPRCTLSSSNDRRSPYFWDAIAFDGTVCLIKAPEKCNSSDKIHILEEAGVQFFPELVYKLVNDNAPSHRSHAVDEWKTRNCLQSGPFPAHSPDLNPIENVWAFMETELRCTKLEFADVE